MLVFSFSSDVDFCGRDAWAGLGDGKFLRSVLTWFRNMLVVMNHELVIRVLMIASRSPILATCITYDVCNVFTKEVCTEVGMVVWWGTLLLWPSYLSREVGRCQLQVGRYFYVGTYLVRCMLSRLRSHL